MLKEVGASGQISLGKKYAGQLFDTTFGADGTVTLVPVRVVPMVQEQTAPYTAPANQPAPTPPDWSKDHAKQIEQYNAWAAERQPYAQRVRQWRESQK
jgi:hypothetical protein